MGRFSKREISAMPKEQKAERYEVWNKLAQPIRYFASIRGAKAFVAQIEKDVGIICPIWDNERGVVLR